MSYYQTNLVSDIPGVARFTDSNLVNPWGLSRSSRSPWIVPDNGVGLATSYSGDGKSPGVIISVAPPSGGTPPSSPTGSVFNCNPKFLIPKTALQVKIFFSTEDGTISAWNTTLGGAVQVVDNSKTSAVYKGIALIGDFLYVANFRAGRIEVYNSNYALTQTFTDPSVPNGFAPFNVKNIEERLYVSFALQDASKHDDVAGPGNGYVNIFSPQGVMMKRLISQGPLNSPWGMTVIPHEDCCETLLVGNFGDGRINSFSLKSGRFHGPFYDEFENPITIQGLWGLEFGNGEGAGRKNELFFTAGIVQESHGLFGKITQI
jgi:uncharacterized protein (TIGR03118 family)